MINGEFIISHKKNPGIKIGVTPGHFTTSLTHYNYYLDMGELKFNSRIAADVAREFSLRYINNTLVDCIVCMERTEVIGAYLADELTKQGVSNINSGQEIHILTPVQTSDNKLIFPDNRKHFLKSKNVLLVLASILSGATLAAAKECIEYYGGHIAGISTMFIQPPYSLSQQYNYLFTTDDIPHFKSFRADECEMCKTGLGLDALIYSEGYRII